LNEATGTHPQLYVDIIKGLTQWHDNDPQHPASPMGTQVEIQQGHIGCGTVLEGCMAKSWQVEEMQFWKANIV